MLAKRSKTRVRFEKVLGGCVKGGIPVGGYEQRLQDTSCRDLVWRNLQDLKEKLPYLICTDKRKMASGTPWRRTACSWPAKSATLWTARDSGEAQNGERRTRKTRWGSHRGQRRRGTAGFGGELRRRPTARLRSRRHPVGPLTTGGNGGCAAWRPAALGDHGSLRWRPTAANRSSVQARGRWRRREQTRC
jgi:hypothetical protein